MLRTTKPNAFSASLSADKIIDDLGITCPSQIDVEAIAMDLGVIVTEGHLTGCEARLLRKGNRGIIRVSNRTGNRHRKRFAVSHELGHWVQHHGKTQLETCSAADLNGYSSSPLETEANIFASNLLMPTLMFRSRCHVTEPSLHVIRQLSEEFDTSATATALRFVKMTEHPCAVVLSENGKIKWSGSSRPYIRLEKGRALNSLSVAGRIQNGVAAPADMVSVSPTAWFSGAKSDLPREVFEGSISLGRYREILTLLWVL